MKNNIRYIVLLLTLSLSTAIYASNWEAPAVDQISSIKEGPEIIANGNTIHIKNATGYTLEIYNITGVLVSSYKIDSAEKTITLNLPKSWYMLKVGKTVRKIALS